MAQPIFSLNDFVDALPVENLEQAIDDAEAEHMGIGMALDILGEEMQKLISRQNVSRAKLMALRAKRRL